MDELLAELLQRIGLDAYHHQIRMKVRSAKLFKVGEQVTEIDQRLAIGSLHLQALGADPLHMPHSSQQSHILHPATI